MTCFHFSRGAGIDLDINPEWQVWLETFDKFYASSRPYMSDNIQGVPEVLERFQVQVQPFDSSFPDKSVIQM
jgi:hypothetical protein